jgi:hypothetical protein
VDCSRWLTASLALVVVALLAATGPIRGAAARELPMAGPAGAFDPLAHEDEADSEEEGDAGEEGEESDDCEFEDEALEEACEEAEEEREVEGAEAEECRLESAEATVAAVPGRNQVRLTVRYRTFEPSAVAIDLGLRGGRGALDLGTDTVHFGRAGALHTAQTLTDPQMARAMAAREFTVGIHALNTPSFCADDFERHLTARKGSGAGLQWSDPGAARRAKASRE